MSMLIVGGRNWLIYWNLNPTPTQFMNEMNDDLPHNILRVTRVVSLGVLLAIK